MARCMSRPRDLGSLDEIEEEGKEYERRLLSVGLKTDRYLRLLSMHIAERSPVARW